MMTRQEIHEALARGEQLQGVNTCLVWNDLTEKQVCELLAGGDCEKFPYVRKKPQASEKFYHALRLDEVPLNPVFRDPKDPEKTLLYPASVGVSGVVFYRDCESFFYSWEMLFAAGFEYRSFGEPWRPCRRAAWKGARARHITGDESA